MRQHSSSSLRELPVCLRSAVPVVHCYRIPLLWPDQLHHRRADGLHGVLHPPRARLQSLLPAQCCRSRQCPQAAPQVNSTVKASAAESDRVRGWQGCH